MKKFMQILLIFSLMMVFTLPTQAETDWTFEIFGGTGFNIPLPLKIEDTENIDDDITINSANYSTKPFDGSPYYAWRVARWEENKAWEIQLVHHKIYLNNDHTDIQNFSISHGYNLITANRAWDKGDYIYRLGAGVVLTHPEFEIYNDSNDQELGIGGAGFYLDGITAQAAIAKQYDITKNIFATTEAMYTASYAKVKPEDYQYEATVPNSALHILAGLGYNF